MTFDYHVAHSRDIKRLSPASEEFNSMSGNASPLAHPTVSSLDVQERWAVGMRDYEETTR
jgi:hypothetical protein